MENEERAHIESYYQIELESVKNEVTRLTDLLEQLLRARNGEETSAQPPAAYIPQASQNQGANSANEQYFVSITPIQQTHAPITMDLNIEGTPNNRSTSLMDHDKLFALEERLRAIEANDWFDPMRAVKVCLVPNIMVPKDFWILDFIKYTSLECLNTYLRSHCNKMAELICDDKLLIYFFQDSLVRSALSWYMRLDNVRIRSWRDLVEAFLKQYKFNLEITPDRTSLMSIEKMS